MTALNLQQILETVFKPNLYPLKFIFVLQLSKFFNSYLKINLKQIQFISNFQPIPTLKIQFFCLPIDLFLIYFEQKKFLVYYFVFIFLKTCLYYLLSFRISFNSKRNFQISINVLSRTVFQIFKVLTQVYSLIPYLALVN